MKSVNAAGEFDIIQIIRQQTRTDRSVILGIGDDTAILRPHPSKELLYTTDMLIEDIHFRLDEASAFEIGRKSLAVNLSDIAAMAGTPRHAVISVGLPSSLSKKFVGEFYLGIRSLARQFGVNIVGGDTNRSAKLVVSVALIGECDKGKAVRRSGAKAGDVIFVSGELGGSYASKKHLLFTPRIEEANFLAKNFKLHAMMDLSDGLAGDVRRIAQESAVGALICEEAVPVAPGALGLEAALSDGEDFELLFTLSPKEAARLNQCLFKRRADFFKPVGKIVHKRHGVALVNRSGKAQPLAFRGFDHFV